MRLLRLLFFLALLNIWGGVRAVPSDSLEVSLLTCSPGTEVYSLYGHTAIRVKSYAAGGEDWTFNYGVFSFSQPHFIWRFALGECDYQLGALPYPYFAAEYEERGSSVYEQVLNLTPEEKLRVWGFLVENMRPENREYRYDYLYDNCTTRARDCIEGAVEGTVVYPKSDSVRTFRSIIHQYTADYPWAELGDDICLGAQADRPISEREEMFAPFYLMKYADGAVIRDAEGHERPLVLSTSEVIKGRMTPHRPEFPLSPGWAAGLLLAVVAVLTFVERILRACFWPLDIVLMTLAGLIGLAVTFLFFFSAHPTVGSNWQIWVFNPIPLFAMPWVVYCAVRHKKTSYHRWNIVVLVFFMIFSLFIPQDFCAVVVPLASALLLRSCSYELSYRKPAKKERNAL